MLLERIKNSQKLEQILLNFIDVLRINILVVDLKGKPVLAPKTNGFGFYGASQWGVFQHLGEPEFLSKFQTEGEYLKHIDDFGFQSFAIPIAIKGLEPIAYLIVGPAILNKLLEKSRYERIAKDLGVDFSDLMDYLNEVRVVSFNSLKSILDLLFELSQYALRMSYTVETKPVHSIFSTLLDLSMALSQAECGSIMILNNHTKELSILAHKGIDPQKFENFTIKLGEGIAGLAAQEREAFVINEEEPNNRIRHLLKKPELKCALVLPIINNNKDVLGVLNISTHQGTSRLATHTQQMLQSLVEITSASFTNFL